jgi:site-specific DNA-methyltransferase (adenine-specific)
MESSEATIHHGDALEILPTLAPMAYDLVVTDPPYVIGAVSAGNIGAKSGGWADMMNSAGWFRDWYAMVRRVLKVDGALWTFCNWRSLPVVMRAAIDSGFPVASVLVWDKQWIGPGGPVGLRPTYELVALLPMPEFTVPNRGVEDIIRMKWTAAKPTGHPAEKPVALFRWLIETSGKGGGRILDPFAGSGTVLAAGASLGCHVTAIEAEDRWVHLAANRPAQLSLGGVA